MAVLYKDCGRAIALLMLAQRLDHRGYNVSSGRLVAYGEVVDAINVVVPGARITLPVGRNPNRPQDNYLDITRLREDTGFRQDYDVESTVRTMPPGRVGMSADTCSGCPYEKPKPGRAGRQAEFDDRPRLDRA